MATWKVLFTSTQLQNVYMVRSLLESEEIPTILRDELTTQNNYPAQAIGGAKLLVPPAEYERAVALLRSSGYEVSRDEQQVVEVIRSADRAHCPYCHSSEISKKRQPDPIMTVISGVLGFLFPLFKSVWGCHDCGKSWQFR